MTNHTVPQQEPAWPKPSDHQMLQIFEQSCQQVCCPAKGRAGRPAKVSWNHFCLAIMLCFLRGWNAQLEVWRLIRGEQVGSFAPVRVSDQAIDNRIEQAATPLHGLFEQMSAWLRARLSRLSKTVVLPRGPPPSTLSMPARVIRCRVCCPGCAR